MTLTIELPDHLARLAADAGLTPEDLSRSALRGVAAEVVATSGDAAARFLAAIADAEVAEMRDALQESAEDIAVGRVTPLEQVIAEAHARRRRRDAATIAS